MNVKPMAPRPTANMYPHDLPQGRARVEKDKGAPRMRPLAGASSMENLSPTVPTMRTLDLSKT